MKNILKNSLGNFLPAEVKNRKDKMGFPVPLTEWIREQDTMKALRIISISTLHDREKSLSAGADVYLPKPFELSSLFNWVDYFLK